MSAEEAIIEELADNPDPGLLGRRLETVTDAILIAGMEGDAGRRLVREIFVQMPGHMDSTRATGVTGVVHWRVGSGECQLGVYQVVIDDGQCRVGERLDLTPTVSFAIEPVALLKLVAGAATGVELMASRQLGVEGDVQFALLTEQLFQIGQPAFGAGE
jgi:hypothetical protein